MQLVDDRKILSMAQMSSGPNAMRALTRRNVCYVFFLHASELPAHVHTF